MAIRLFDWRDLPKLLRYRNKGMYFDNVPVLTRGTTLVPAGALLSYFAPATGIYTFLCSDHGNPGQPLMGQVIHPYGSTSARLSFLAPESALESPSLTELLEHMFVQVGERGAFHLLAEVDERSIAFEALRRASFAIYARQRIWLLTGDPKGATSPISWQVGTEQDLSAARSLYNNLVPGLVQQVEQPAVDHLNGMVYRQGDELLAYTEIKSGGHGIWMQPFIHPDAEEVAPRLADLLQHLPNRRSRPIYICVRSYQSWLEPAIADLGAEAGPPQAVMVKHLAVAKKVTRQFALRTLEGGQPEATAPFVRSECKK